MDKDLLEVLLGAGLIIILFAILVGVGITVMYLLTLQNVLKKVAPENRLVEPTNVWLMFIPLFNLIYPFILYPKISDSIKKEYEARGLALDGNFGRSIGLAIPILNLCGIIPFLGIFASLAGLVLWIIWWVKMAGYKTKLS